MENIETTQMTAEAETAKVNDKQNEVIPATEETSNEEKGKRPHRRMRFGGTASMYACYDRRYCCNNHFGPSVVENCHRLCLWNCFPDSIFGKDGKKPQWYQCGKSVQHT